MDKTIQEMYEENFDPMLAQKKPIKIDYGYGLPVFDDYSVIFNVCSETATVSDK